jgi:hypothetical protein
MLRPVTHAVIATIADPLTKAMRTFLTRNGMVFLHPSNLCKQEIAPAQIEVSSPRDSFVPYSGDFAALCTNQYLPANRKT